MLLIAVVAGLAVEVWRSESLAMDSAVGGIPPLNQVFGIPGIASCRFTVFRECRCLYLVRKRRRPSAVSSFAWSAISRPVAVCATRLRPQSPVAFAAPSPARVPKARGSWASRGTSQTSGPGTAMVQQSAEPRTRPRRGQPSPSGWRCAIARR